MVLIFSFISFVTREVASEPLGFDVRRSHCVSIISSWLDKPVISNPLAPSLKNNGTYPAVIREKTSSATFCEDTLVLMSANALS